MSTHCAKTVWSCCISVFIVLVNISMSRKDIVILVQILFNYRPHFVTSYSTRIPCGFFSDTRPTREHCYTRNVALLTGDLITPLNWSLCSIFLFLYTLMNHSILVTIVSVSNGFSIHRWSLTKNSCWCFGYSSWCVHH